jgi:ATP-dependent DNA helicase RecG
MWAQLQVQPVRCYKYEISKQDTVSLKISLAGKVDFFSNRRTFVNPEYEIVNGTSKKVAHTRGLVPIYPETSGVSSKWLRSKISQMLPELLPKIDDSLPNESLKRHGLLPRGRAIWQIHCPKNTKEIERARKRLAFEEILFTQLVGLQRKSSWQKNLKGIKLNIPQEEVLKLISTLPFHLTSAQNKVLKEILKDLSISRPMNRLLQGDVGSGKTVVAAIASYVTYLNGYQSSIMAPTEILAIQHFNSLKGVLSPLGVKVSIRTSSIKQSGDFDILVGTHSLITKQAQFEKLALVVIDEQHRFGVEQRAQLRVKGASPHVLTMTATPIPRSLALTFYGDLDLSILDELPENRKKIKTFVVPLKKRNGAYQFIKKNISSGKQAYIVCPLIEPSETLITVKAAKEEYERLRTEVFPNLSLGLLHGRLKSKEKEEIINKFRSNELNILVSTPVVEVGIDIPNAIIMMVEGSERFGLASLHQLRGRVGRGAEQSFSLLFTDSSSNIVIRRLKTLEKHHLGIKLAELDLKMRGPGQIYGTAQSGLPSFKIASINNLPLIKEAKNEADLLSERINQKNMRLLKLELNRQALVTPD